MTHKRSARRTVATRKPRKAARAHKAGAHTAHVPPPDIIAAAQQSERDTGVPTSVTLAQWALESGWGKKQTGANNAFGIKARKGEPGLDVPTHERVGSKLVPMMQRFRSYSSLDEAFRAHAELLSKHYPISMAHTNDPNAFADGLQADPNHQYANTTGDYAGSLKTIMRQNNFYQYDLKNAGATSPSAGGGGPQVSDGERSVMLGSAYLLAAHVESPHTGGGKIISGSPTVFVGKKKLPFARQGDVTNDSLQVKSDVQDDVLIG
jgi:flagellum-specific peptidoglycan hydrolase FlgJ